MSLPSTVLLRTQSDARLVVLARDGHERAFEAIVERYRRPLLRACRRVLPEARAEDALQHALLAAWAALQRGDEVRDLRAWLYRIAHNTALNQLRVNGYDHDELHELLRGATGTEEEAERRMVVRATLTGLAALPERQREALLQIAVQGRGQEAVAQELGLSEGAVRALVHRARVQLRAAATAVTPMPLAVWLASAGPQSAAIGERIGELGAGGGIAASAAKLGAVAVLAGGVAAGPAVIHVARHDGSRGAAAAGTRADRHGGRGEPEPGDDRGGRDEPVLADADGRRGAPGGRDAPGSSRGRGHHGSPGEDRSGSSRGPGGDGGREESSGEDRSGPSRRSSGDDDRRASSGGGASGSPGGDRSGPSGGDGGRADSSGEDRSGSSGPSGGDDGARIDSSGDGGSGSSLSSGDGGSGSSLSSGDGASATPLSSGGDGSSGDDGASLPSSLDSGSSSGPGPGSPASSGSDGGGSSTSSSGGGSSGSSNDD